MYINIHIDHIMRHTFCLVELNAVAME